MSSFVYLPAVRDFHAKLHDWVADPFKVILLEAGYVPDKTHEFVSSVAAFEASLTGYIGGFAGAGRRSITSKTLTIANPYVVCDAADPDIWFGLNFGTIVAACIIREYTSDADSKLITYMDGFTVVTDGRNVQGEWHADGAFRLINLEDL